jgi:PAS domain S-box-containing protein
VVLLSADTVFRRVLEDAEGYAVMVLDCDGFVRLCNRGVERLCGYGPGEVVGAHLSLFYLADEHAAGAPDRDLARTAAAGRLETEGWRRRKDGTRFWAINTFTALRGEGGELDGFGAITRDGEVDRDMALLEALFQSSPVGLVFVDRELRVRRINRSLASMIAESGLPRLGQTIYEMLPRLSRQSPLFSNVERVLATGAPLNDFEIAAHLPGKSGVSLLSVGLFPVFAGAVLIGVGAAVREVTERRRSEEERDLFLAALGHDLRNPLSAIAMAAQLLANRELDEPLHRAVTQIVSGTQRMARLINDLLDLARARRGGGIPLSPGVVDLQDICREVIVEAQLRVPEQPIRLHSESCVGSYDRDRIFQVVQNLVGNAVEHGAPGRPIVVSLAPAREWCTIAVCNEGPRIPPDVRAHLFDPFYSERRKRRGGGLGLGLYIARQLVEAHRGRIAIDSTDERTIFTVELPRNETARAR